MCPDADREPDGTVVFVTVTDTDRTWVFDPGLTVIDQLGRLDPDIERLTVDVREGTIPEPDNVGLFEPL